MGLVSLREINDDCWQAQYEGRFGVYTVYVKTDDQTFVESRCNCHDRKAVCKHIEIVRAVIKDRRELRVKC